MRRPYFWWPSSQNLPRQKSMPSKNARVYVASVILCSYYHTINCFLTCISDILDNVELCSCSTAGTWRPSSVEKVWNQSIGSSPTLRGYSLRQTDGQNIYNRALRMLPQNWHHLSNCCIHIANLVELFLEFGATFTCQNQGIEQNREIQQGLRTQDKSDVQPVPPTMWHT